MNINNQLTDSQEYSDQSNQFDIHKKMAQSIKNGGVGYSYLKAAQPHQDGAKYEHIAIFYPSVEFLIYRRIGEYYVLVDFFKNYDEACEEAKSIIDEHADFKASINAWSIIPPTIK